MFFKQMSQPCVMRYQDVWHVPKRAMYVNTATCNDWGRRMGGGACHVGEGINQKQYIIKDMTCGMGFHLMHY